MKKMIIFLIIFVFFVIICCIGTKEKFVGPVWWFISQPKNGINPQKYYSFSKPYNGLTINTRPLLIPGQYYTQTWGERVYNQDT